jgi:hypothetical protein
MGHGRKMKDIYDFYFAPLKTEIIEITDKMGVSEQNKLEEDVFNKQLLLEETLEFDFDLNESEIDKIKPLIIKSLKIQSEYYKIKKLHDNYDNYIINCENHIKKFKTLLENPMVDESKIKQYKAQINNAEKGIFLRNNTQKQYILQLERSQREYEIICHAANELIIYDTEK